MNDITSIATSIRRITNGLGFALCFVSLLIINGCKITDNTAPAPTHEEGRALYLKVMAAQNERVGSLSRFWSQAVVEARWTEEGGRKRFEQGDGHLILSFPDKAALTVGKLGSVKFWAGSDGKQVWLYDEMSDKVLSVGQVNPANGQGGNALQQSPLLVKPSDFPRLLGVLPLPDLPPLSVESKKIHARVVGETIIVDVPGDRSQMTFDAKSLQPVKVTLLDKDGKPMMTADLSRYERMEKENAAIGPFVPRTIALKMISRDGSLTVYLDYPTDVERRVKDKLFDLEYLKTVLKPKRIVNLDKPVSSSP